VGKPLRVLIVEDSEDDVQLMILALKRGGYDPVYERVETAEAMGSSLREKGWDVILCDYKLPTFNGLAAIELLKNTELDLSLIIVSGAIGEETAVEAMKAGAHDYIMKDNLYRLIPAIERELNETEERRARRLAEKQLKESNERFVALFDRLYDAVYIVDFEGKFVEANQVALDMLGYEKADIPTLSITSLLSEEDLSKGLEDFNEMIKVGIQKDVSEYKLKRKDGTLVTVETKASVIYWNGRPHSVLGIARDITGRKRAEEMLRESEEKYRVIFEGSTQGILATDTETGRFLYANPSICRMLGYSDAELLRLSIKDIHPKESLAQVVSDIGSQIQGKKPISSTVPCLRKDGTVFFADISGAISKIKGRECSVGFFSDITERKRVEESLQESEESYRNLFKNANEAIFVGLDSKVVFYNPMTIKILGYSGEELVSKPLNEFIHPDDRDMVIDCFVRQLKGERILQSYDFRIIQKNGNIRWVVLNSVMINWKEKPATLNFLSDITERKQSEEALRESEERYRVLIEKSNDGIAMVKGDRYIFVNQKMVEIFGYDRPEEFMGQQVTMVIHPDDRERVAAINYRRQKGESVSDKYETKGQRKKGEPVYIEVSAAETTYKGETVSLGYLRDITDRRLTEEALKTLSLKDDLTGLYNRRGFFTLAEQGLKTAQRMGTDLVLIFGDLDNLKGINDTFGHKEGDQVLMDISKIFKETFRESDILARIGGDEFVVLAMNNLETSAEKLINRFTQALNDHHFQTKCPYTLSISLGMACFDPQNPCSIDALLAQADKLMYENKQKKRRVGIDTI
jgi:diguanylate cyclase (GGDEF)-like protein/PAS domain S-box-containing protein